MNQSQSIAELAKALAKAQGEIEGAKKDSQNPHFKSRYADLASVWDACRAALSQNGLSVVQLPGDVLIDEHGARVVMTTMLLHASGEWISETMSIPAQATAQGIGSALTYARRYSLAAAVGVAPEDDDAEAATGRPNGKTESKPDPSAMAAVKKGAFAVLKRLSLKQVDGKPLADPVCLDGGMAGTLARESLRRTLMGDVVFDAEKVEDWRAFWAALTKYEDGHTKKPEAESLL